MFAEFSNGIIVLLAQVRHGLLMLNVGFLKITTKFGQFSFAAFVKLDLSRCGTTGFLETFTEFLDFASKIGTLLFSLGTSLALSFKFLFEFFNAGLLE